MAIWKRWICLLCLLPLSLILCIGTTHARYNKSDGLSTVVGSSVADSNTMNEDVTVYHFGEWRRGDDRVLSHTIVLQDDAPLKGTLRFSWDAETTAAADAFVAMNIGGNGSEYAVNLQQTRAEFPFTLIFSSTDRSATMTLDVAWIPQGASEATQFSRYLIERNPHMETGVVSTGGDFSFVAADTRFLTERLLTLSVKVPREADRLILSAGSGTSAPFAAGTVYYTDQYPQGVTLLSDSVLYLPAENEDVQVLLQLMNTHAGVPITVTAALSALTFVTSSQTPAADATPLTVAVDPAVPVVSYQQPLVFKVTVPTALADTEWNKADGASAQLTWQVERLVDGHYQPVTLGTDMVVTVSKSATIGTLTVTVPTGHQPAGTYRLTVAQTYRDYEIRTAAMWFFVDYR